jgi:hypothetical protein
MSWQAPRWAKNALSVGGTVTAFAVAFAATAYKQQRWLVAFAAGIAAAAAVGYTFLTRTLMKEARRQSEAAWEQVELGRIQAEAQAEAFQTQIEATREQSRIARDSLEAVRHEARRAERATEESRLDRSAPQVIMRLTRSPEKYCVVQGIAAGRLAQEDVVYPDMTRTFEDAAALNSIRIVANLVLKIENYGSHPARIDFINLPEIDWPQGLPLILLPGLTKVLRWRRATSVAAEHVNGGQSTFSVVQPEIWVRDLGMNIRDTFGTNIGLGWFGHDGSRLTLTPAEPDGEPYLIPIGRRLYEQLDSKQVVALAADLE